MYIYILNTIYGKYINISKDPLDTYKEHLRLLKDNKHNNLKLQAIYNKGFNIDLEIICEVNPNLATMLMILYINKQKYTLNSVNDMFKYANKIIFLQNQNNICIIKEYEMIIGIEIANYESGYYKVHPDHLEWIEGIE